jgi:hypothetical protein
MRNVKDRVGGDRRGALCTGFTLVNIDCLVILIVDAMVLAWRAHHCGFCTLGCVVSALWGVVFCLDFGPFLFLPLFPCWVFFL